MGSDGMTNTEKAIAYFEAEKKRMEIRPKTDSKDGVEFTTDDEKYDATVEALRALRIVQKMEGEPVLDLMRENERLRGRVARLEARLELPMGRSNFDMVAQSPKTLMS